MNIPENRNAKGEDFAKFAAEMAQLAKRPELRPFLTSTERRRQEQEEKRDEAEAKRRGTLIDKWFESQMQKMDPDTWAKFQATMDPKVLEDAGWHLDMESMEEQRLGEKPRPYTVLSITKIGMLFWDEPKVAKPKIIKPGEA